MARVIAKVEGKEQGRAVSSGATDGQGFDSAESI